jgi:hypothetical protein
MTATLWVYTNTLYQLLRLHVIEQETIVSPGKDLDTSPEQDSKCERLEHKSELLGNVLLQQFAVCSAVTRFNRT